MSTTTAKQTQTTEAVRTALYVRISSDRDDSELGVKRQEKEGRAYVKRRGWSLVELYIDNDISASNGDPRPEWDRLMRDVRAGRIDAIVGWAFDRLTRTPRELEDVIDLHDELGVQLGTVGGDIDLSTAMGRMTARILSNVARNEIEQKRERQLAERRQAAERGVPHFGGSRPFGYADDRVTIDESEAVIVRELAYRVLHGESLRGLTEELAQRGIKGATGKAFTTTALRNMLTSARISGRREHWQGRKGERRPLIAPIVGPGQWDGIIDEADNDALRRLLGDTSRRSAGSNARKYLLPGFLRCGQCDAPMKSHQSATKQGKQLAYACFRDVGQPVGCRKQIQSQPADAHVVGMLLAKLDTAEYEAMLHEKRGVDPALVEQVTRDRIARDELMAERIAGDLTVDEWRVARDALTKRIDRTQADIDDLMHDDALSYLRGEGAIEARWEALTLAQQRAVIGAAIERVVIHPATRFGGVFDTGRIEVIWRG